MEVEHHYTLTEAAEKDLRAIMAHTAADSVHAAWSLASEFEDRFVTLATRPHLGELRPDLTDQPVRSYVLYPYLIVYRSEPLSACILRIVTTNADIVPI